MSSVWSEGVSEIICSLAEKISQSEERKAAVGRWRCRLMLWLALEDMRSLADADRLERLLHLHGDLIAEPHCPEEVMDETERMILYLLNGAG